MTALKDTRLRSSQTALYRGLIRDHHGNWIVGFNKYVGISQSLHVELSGILEAHSDPLALVQAISKAWIIEFILVRREANSYADFMAKLSSFDGVSSVFVNPPQGVIKLLNRDLRGPLF
ncbi:hypothetical protein F3Y22_tig00110597pilonHSYRG00167 [Hibiscus syriacus]|uniref:RNase H type-1 domain-containing protein n=1 Tax=Hibiscus syriacus TaxID=106335 RepID=A0A6A3A2L3_HIBSY|nr:hypothetical protein F3Y22_tig00110597pilonHSYRG00167 [Hibiscus syriacus]